MKENKALSTVDVLPNRWQEHKLASIKKPKELNWQEFFVSSSTKQADKFLTKTRFNWLYLLPFVGFFHFLFVIETEVDKLKYDKIKNQYLKVGGENWGIFVIFYLAILISYIVAVLCVVYLTDYFYPTTKETDKKIALILMLGTGCIYFLMNYTYILYWYKFTYIRFKNSIPKIIKMTKSKISPNSFFSFIIICDDNVFLKKLEKENKKHKFKSKRSSKH
ncbi:hypothetical protein [Mycoplasma sp. E35C]|uniref:hypothetical protein n=1 Tax=Mycoplasma sp. E35C TaxID=2801918 RepID=UPI001CA3B739|nr:hypothetical protein [Mycoplasma sp. E35C]QZX48823.1 hypothetical protein JJE79_02060 [Mycoplasma sp. E35C]